LEEIINSTDPLPGTFSLLAAISTPSIVNYTLNGVVILILLALSAIISGAEVAFFSLSSEDVNRCKLGKKPVYKPVQKFKHFFPTKSKHATNIHLLSEFEPSD
jgi:hypothetical protein